MIENNQNLDNSPKSSFSVTYEEAVAEIEKMVKSFENQDDSLDNLLKNVEQANELIQHCKNKLRAIENDAKKIL